MLVANLGLVAAAVFTGAAFYVNFAEQKARLILDERALLAEWKFAYKRGYAMQAPLAIIGFVLGVGASLLTHRMAFLAGATLLVANWPWTLVGMMPTNNTLMATDPEDAGPASRKLIMKWNKLHAVRTILGALAILAFLIALAER